MPDELTLTLAGGGEGRSGLDTSHELTIHIPHAPPGTRTEVTRAEGPATLGVRTSYSNIGQPW